MVPNYVHRCLTEALIIQSNITTSILDKDVKLNSTWTLFLSELECRCWPMAKFIFLVDNFVYFILNGHVHITTEEGLGAETCEFIYIILMLQS